MIKLHRGEIISLIIVILSFALGAYVYPQLPEQVASHWDAQGQVNGYMGKFWGVFLLPLILAGMWLIFLVVPNIDPKHENIQKFRSSFDNFMVVMFAFMLYIYLLIIAWNLGYQFDFVRFIVPACAVLFFAVGSLVTSAKPNWSIGIRTPWTMSSTSVWEKTHALGGTLFKAAALVSLIGIFFPTYGIWFIIVPIIGASLWTVIYSYVEYQKES